MARTLERATDVEVALRMANRCERLVRLTSLEDDVPEALIEEERCLISTAAAEWLRRYPSPELATTVARRGD